MKWRVQGLPQRLFWCINELFMLNYEVDLMCVKATDIHCFLFYFTLPQFSCVLGFKTMFSLRERTGHAEAIAVLPIWLHDRYVGVREVMFGKVRRGKLAKRCS